MTGQVVYLHHKGRGEVALERGIRVLFRREDLAHPEIFDSLLGKAVDFDLLVFGEPQPRAIRVRPTKASQ